MRSRRCRDAAFLVAGLHRPARPITHEIVSGYLAASLVQAARVCWRSDIGPTPGQARGIRRKFSGEKSLRFDHNIFEAHCSSTDKL
jgi:hypothetical protein